MTDIPTPGTCLLHPDADPNSPHALRLLARAVTHAEWPWIRFTGHPNDVPNRGSDLSEWPTQSLADVGRVLGT